MATISGSAGLVKVAAATVAELTGFSIEETANTIGDTQLTDTADTHLAGRTSFSGSIDCNFDSSDSTGQEAMTIGASISLTFQPAGTGSGLPEYTGTATITGRSMAIADETTVSQSFSITGNGALTRGSQT